MSDISIPGVNSKYGTDKMIEGLMDVERIPLRRLEDQKETYEDQKKIWRDINLALSRFKDSSRELFGFQNPFQEHIAESSDETIVSASASRDASNEIVKIRVDQVASSDRFLSSPLPDDFRVPDGTYSFRIGENDVSFRFRENRLLTFIDAVNKRSKGLIKARLINDTSDTVVFMLESTKTGSSNKLILSDDSIELGLSTGLIRTVHQNTGTVDLSTDSILSRQSAGKEDIYTVLNNSLTLEPESEIKIPFSPIVDMKENLILEYDIQIINLDKEEYIPKAKPGGPEINSSGSTDFEGIRIDNSPSRVNLPEWTQPPPPVIRDSMNIMYLNGNIQLPDLKDTEAEQHFSIPYSLTGSTISSIDIKNVNTHRQIIIRGIKVTNPDARAGFEAINPAGTALDAKLEIDGIPIIRETNSIDDLIQGVTLNINKTSDKVVEIEIMPDKESIKDGIISFVGYYNQVLQNIHILTSNDESVIGELEYLSDEEKEDARNNLGTFQGDMTFSQLKNRMQRIAMEAYRTSAGRDLSLLSQIGISTNSSGFGGGVNKSKLRGYLEINEDTLDEALSSDIQPIKDLFGRDTDGDFIIDTGAAYEMDRYINSYTQIGGLVASRISGIDTQINRTERSIRDMESKLDDKELELKIKFGRMEAALKTMEQSSSAIENFSNNN
jgi:flagellar hook-associated protein 2